MSDIGNPGSRPKTQAAERAAARAAARAASKAAVVSREVPQQGVVSTSTTGPAAHIPALSIRRQRVRGKKADAKAAAELAKATELTQAAEVARIAAEKAAEAAKRIKGRPHHSSPNSGSTKKPNLFNRFGKFLDGHISNEIGNGATADQIKVVRGKAYRILAAPFVAALVAGIVALLIRQFRRSSYVKRVSISKPVFFFSNGYGTCYFIADLTVNGAKRGYIRYETREGEFFVMTSNEFAFGLKNEDLSGFNARKMKTYMEEIADTEGIYGTIPTNYWFVKYAEGKISPNNKVIARL